MRQNPSLRATAAVTFAVLATCAGLHAASPTLVIRVYDFASIDEGSLATALEAAAAIVNDAGVAASWRDCTRGSVNDACHAMGHTRQLIVRIFPAAAVRVPAAGASLRSGANEHVALASAVIGPGTPGTLATVFFDEVGALAHRTGLDVPTLLGRVIAHEVGHLLLNANTHGRSGLMREVWTDEELALNRPADWLFAPAERRLLTADHGRRPAGGQLTALAAPRPAR